ncbi:MAG: pyridoxamine 5'-phosphate oxidase family protein [Candidatus Rokubacteria bacterium]|nr:pyridoxamine 5'-phosphate oxidase family protein [Candidatus Rokubacteria bacterium]
MSRSLGPSLPPDLLARLSQSDLPSHLGKAIPLITVDREGRPHPMLLSYLEVRAADPRTIRIVIGARSRSCRNLLERQTATLLVVEPDLTVYIKARASEGPFPVPDLADFALVVLTVEDVLEDAPGDWEGTTRITGDIRYAPVPSLDAPWARATLEALALTPGR